MAYPLIVFLYYFRLKKHVIYWVIGSEIVRRIKADENNHVSFKKKYFHYLDKIIVESSMMERQLTDEGLRNVVTVPNFKKIFHVKPIEKSKSRVVRFVFLSRISPEKGCNYILNCVERLDKAGYKDMFRVTFYGKVEEGYEAFNSRVESLKNTEYKGLLDLTNKKGYEVMADNDVFLFPTFFPNEGFPGALIDAMIAGLPVIASDWNYNKELVVEGKTGVVIPAHDEERLYEEMLAFIEGKHDIAKMREACMNEASKYDVDEVLSIDNLVNLGVMTK
jgi:glycosyltransferase involved in cell wall biosynthesis